MEFCEILEQLLSRIIVVDCFLNENREGEEHAVTLLLSGFHFFRGSCLLSYETMFILRGGSKTATTSNMMRLVTIINGWKPLTIITRYSILDVAAALDPPLAQVFA